jgi:hypothetical protein
MNNQTGLQVEVLVLQAATTSKVGLMQAQAQKT